MQVLIYMPGNRQQTELPTVHNSIQIYRQSTTLPQMAQLSNWRQIYDNAYVRNTTDDLDTQERALRAVSDRLQWLSEEHATWTQIGNARGFNNWRPLQQVRAEDLRVELDEATHCLEEIRDYHLRKARELHRQNTWVDSRIQLFAPLAKTARYALVRHRCEELIQNCAEDGAPLGSFEEMFMTGS